ncbi:MAG: phosphoglucosamine mutase [Calditrichales bacterium]|nr:MAG: phosphoglucosamine mutase [Calditrichales bacterium]
MAALMVSISGIRGIVGKSLTPAVVQKYAMAFGETMKQSTVIVGGDSRTSGTFIKNIVKGCLQACGCNVIDVGIVPTPTLQMEILHHKAAGGVAITASHNPSEWNGLKFMGADGRFLSPQIAQAVYDLADRGSTDLKTWESIGSETSDPGANQRHIDAVLNLPYIDLPALRQRKFKVVADTVNGAGGLIIPQLLESMGCEVVVINGEANGHFAHTPEPLPENLVQLSAAVKSNGADIGFAVDPDVDRCAIIDNTGSPIGEEYTLAAAVKFILSKKLGPVVVNMSTSRASEDIARFYNCPFYRSKVGEINVVEEMARQEAVIGGEGNGGVILPELHLGRDAPLAIALTLQALLESNDTMETLAASLPRYRMVKSKINIEDKDPDKIIQQMIDRFSDKPTNLLDGLKIDGKDNWVHLRKSNTEPIIRIISEAPSEEKAQSLVKEYTDIIQSL